MLLKNLMEEKQLDFNQPFLSVRRHTPLVPAPESEGKRKNGNSLPKIPRPPIYKSELKSGPVRNPGTVPFVWEKAPGRPKEESSSQMQALERPPVAPKLPPGRVFDDKKLSSRKASDGKTFSPLPTGSVISSFQNVSSANQIEMQSRSCSGEMEETRSSGSKESDEAYVDALDTLSRTDSFFFNCSISGISGLDGPEIKPSGIYSADPQTRDFMMGRFLPAAKAVASETPPHATRKQPVAREAERQIKMPVIVDKQKPLYVSSRNNFQYHAQDGSCEESEDEDDYSQSDNMSTKVCGLFPQFLLKNSFCLLNPVPGMKIPAEKPVKQAYSVRTRQARSSYMRSGSETEDEHAKVAKKVLTVISRTEGLTEYKKKLNSGSSQMSQRSGCQRSDGASLFRRLPGNDVSSYFSQTAQLVHQQKGFLGVPEKAKSYGVNSIDLLKKGRNNFRELQAIESINQESGSDSPVVEKTLYVDSVHKVIPSNSYFSDTALAVAHHMEDDSGVLIKPGEMEDTHSVDSSFQDTKHSNGVDDEKAIVQHKGVDSVDSYSLFSPVKHACDMQLDAENDYRRDQHLIQDSGKLTCLNVSDNRKDDRESQVHSKLSNQGTAHGLIEDSVTFTKSKVAEPRKIGSESHLNMKSRNNQETSQGSHLKLPLALPLPKAPSESWLKRALPAVSSRNASSRSCLGTCKYLGTQASPGDPKWETIVRSSNVHNGRLRFSEEQLPPIPEA